jgi:hypothetical protein
MTCYDHGGVEEDDSSILTASVPTTETANFISPTVHIRTVRNLQIKFENVFTEIRILLKMSNPKIDIFYVVSSS